jgi:hypothetical protein
MSYNTFEILEISQSYISLNIQGIKIEKRKMSQGLTKSIKHEYNDRIIVKNAPKI